MSRSYKKHPFGGDDKHLKKEANHKVRQYLKQHPEDSLKGNSYKKLFERWDICDYWSRCTWEQYWNSCKKHWNDWRWRYEESLDKEKEYQNWQKYYRRK